MEDLTRSTLAFCRAGHQCWLHRYRCHRARRLDLYRSMHGTKGVEALARAGLMVSLSAVAALCAVGCGSNDDTTPEPSSTLAEYDVANASLPVIDAGHPNLDDSALPVVEADATIATPSFKAAKVSGAKCKSTTEISADGKELSIVFDDFTAELTPARGLTAEVCSVTLDLDLPEGHSVAVEQVNADVSAHLGVGVVGSIESSLSFVTSLDRVAARAKSITGPFSGPVALPRCGRFGEACLLVLREPAEAHCRTSFGARERRGS